jgi:hypothetical protein
MFGNVGSDAGSDAGSGVGAGSGEEAGSGVGGTGSGAVSFLRRLPGFLTGGLVNVGIYYNKKRYNTYTMHLYLYPFVCESIV